MTDTFSIAGLAWSPVYVLDGEVPVLFEAGFHCARRLYEDDIRQATQGRNPQYLFLTHVHWDHCGAASYLKTVFPGLRVASSRRAAEIVSRPNARALMEKLSQDVIPLVARVDGVAVEKLIREPFEPFEIDVIVGGGEVIEVGRGRTIHVLESPGHTRDMLSYYIPEARILIATEAAGVLDQANQVIAEFLVDFDLYMESLKRLALLDVNILCQGHHFVFTGDDVKRFFERSMQAAEEFERHVIELLDRENGSIERVVQRIKAEQYDTNKGVKQSEQAYLLNVTARVNHLAKRAARKSESGVTGHKYGE